MALLSRAASVPLMAAALLIAGCETPREPSSTSGSPASTYNLAGYPAAFKQGYADACASPRRRNEERYKYESDYSMGWNDGQNICRK